jgi:septal ring factor EnvC (AmiA/AmiB activator)
MAVRPLLLPLLVLLVAQSVAATTTDLSKVSASMEKNRSAVKKVSRTIDELKRRREELRRELAASKRQLVEITAGWQSLERETGVQEANLEESGRITGELRRQAVRLAASGGELPPAVEPLLTRSLSTSSRAVALLKEGWAGRVEQKESAERERQALLDRIAAAEAELAEVEEESRSQTQVRDRLQKEAASLRKVFTDLSGRGTAGAVLGKRFPWPIEGTTAKAAGELRGIIISPGESGTARAVAGGEVVYADPLPGLGTVVILQHGEYFTVYGNLASSPLAAKRPVKLGDAVGAVEKGLDAKKGGLYFEVRHHDRALDPLEWLASLPGPVEKPR